MDSAADPLTPRLRRLSAHLSSIGAIRSPAVAHAFATVRRDRCVVTIHGPEGVVTVPQDVVPPPGILDFVYEDQPLVTRLDAATGAPLSSSSQPALVARMLEALELSPGLRVLEVGAGSGYNAALISAVTGAPVMTVDAHEQTAEGARAAIERLGLSSLVTVAHADGFDGHPGAAPYDRLIVTCGCTGLSPRWLDQLADGGLALVPIAQGGVHPVVAVRRPRRSVRGQAVIWADFMPASGRLGSGRHPLLQHVAPSAVFTRHADLGPVLDWDAYKDLWFYLAAHDRRVTRVATSWEGVDLAQGACVLHAPETGTAAVVQMDGSVTTTGDPAIMSDVARLVADWEALGRPPIGAWRCAFTDPAPVHAPLAWHLG